MAAIVRSQTAAALKTSGVRRRRARLLHGVSAVAVVTAASAGAAHGQSIAALNHAAKANAAVAAANPTTPPPPNTAPVPGQASAALRQLVYQARMKQGVDMATQAQQAARAAALSLNQGSVPNGLVIGGLKPVSNPVKAADDTTGLHTWQGADQPVQQTSTDGKVAVTVNQTDSRAILSWETFNVGADTTLTFNQKVNGVGQKDYVVLNRVVGQLDPTTGLRVSGQTAAPSQILGAIKADGTVLVLNGNGVLFGPTSQINTNSFVATSLEIGRAVDANGPLTIGQRNSEFLRFGLLGYADQASANDKISAFTFSAQQVAGGGLDPQIEGEIKVAAGAQITSGDGGYILLTGPKVTNAGHLVSNEGEVALQSGRQVILTRSQGTTGSADPNVRGFVVSATSREDDPRDYVVNEQSGLIEVPKGYISLGASRNGAVIEKGVLHATTGVSRNGYVNLQGGDIQLSTGSTIAIEADDGPETIPQDPASSDAFKRSRVQIGDATSRIEMQSDAMIYAPAADVVMGAGQGLSTTIQPTPTVPNPDDPENPLPGEADPGRVFIDDGAVIDVAGLQDVLIPASRNQIAIRPVKKNELRDTPDYKDGFLNGATVYVDPRLSGVRADGVAWIGSPLIEAASYYAQVGVKASELMTAGGNITLGTSAVSSKPASGVAPSVVVKSGAKLDLSGGWVTYEAGAITTTKLINSAGQVVDISQANPNDKFVGIYNGYTDYQARWGISRTYVDPILSGQHLTGSYTEGRDAGALTIKSPVVVLDGTVDAQAFPGAKQLTDAQTGTGATTVYGDVRHVQGAPSQMPVGGMLYIQALGKAGDAITGGGDIQIVDETAYEPVRSGLQFGQTVSIDKTGALVVPGPREGIGFSADRYQTIVLSDAALSSMGLSQLSLGTTGQISEDAGAQVVLAAGGTFDALAGGRITVAGDISAPAGVINLQTVDTGIGSIFNPLPREAGAFDIVVSGRLSTRGLWVNDYGRADGDLQGSSFTSGGSINLISAARVTDGPQRVNTPTGPVDPADAVNHDISGSIVLANGSLLDVSGGGYVRSNGTLDLSAKGGNVSLINQTNFFQVAQDPNQPGGLPGLRVTTIVDSNGQGAVAVNPEAMTSRVTLDGTILAAGFNGGGTFRLDTPQFSFGDGDATVGTELPLDFFSRTGFGAYNITSYKTALLPNHFHNDLGGTNALLDTQTVTIGKGQTLNLTQTTFSPLVDAAHLDALHNLATGGDLYSVLTPGIAADAWDRKAVSLNLGGLIELHVAKGGAITGEAGSVLGVSKLWNEGSIVIHGGTIQQSEVLPTIYTGDDAIGVHDLSEVFSSSDRGEIKENKASNLDRHLTNGQVAATRPIYLLGELGADEGIRLGKGSVIDLSGVAIINPRAPVIPGTTQQATDGKVIDGGKLVTLPGQILNTGLFLKPFGVGVFSNLTVTASRAGEQLNAAPGSTIDISGASATFDRVGAGGDYAPTPVWSNGGTLSIAAGGTITGAHIDAHGGADQALGGTLVALDPVLYARDPVTPTADAYSAKAIENAGFSTFQALGSISAVGDVQLSLDRGFFLSARPVDDLAALANPATRDNYAPVVRGGGNLEIDAAYIRFDGTLQTLSAPITVTPPEDGSVPPTYSAIFRAQAMDIQGAVQFDPSLGHVTLDSAGDLRLIGVAPYQKTYGTGDQTVAPSLQGQLAVGGDLLIRAGQVYPTTGTTFAITSSAADGKITFAKAAGDTPATPYSAGGALTVQAAKIVQGGVIRVPIGQLTLGSSTAYTGLNSGSTTVFAPATKSLTLKDGSITSVSADGLVIPYGTTTDQIEWFFSPTGADELKAPPSAQMNLGGTNVDLQSGATVNVKGGGDLYAYEFISGTGGSRDVLDRFNNDPYSGNNGYQYPDGRQVYAVVPGLSDKDVAAYDPLYSSDYGALYGASDAGKRVYLQGVQGLAAGWYTLLPAKYALLPGGFRVVENTGATGAIPGSAGVLGDGTYEVAGYYGTAGANAQESTVRVFDVQDQATFLKYSQIARTYANAHFSQAAAHDGVAAPRLPQDAGRLVLAPVQSLNIDATFQTAPATGGRGAQADISGTAFQIVSEAGAATTRGVITLTADSLTRLNASSLLIGGVRTDNADGTTSLDVTAHAIDVANDAAHPLTGPETLLAVDGDGSTLTIEDGAVIKAAGAADPRSGDLVIDGSGAAVTGSGALVRVANGPERLLERTKPDAVALEGALSVGAATLDGQSVLMNASGDFTVAADADIKASNLALGAGQVTFADDPTGLTGLVITPELQARFGQAQHLTVQSQNALDFAAGTYTFGDLRLDAPGLALIGGDNAGVTVNAGHLTLSNLSGADIGTDAVGCADATCAGRTLTLNSTDTVFGKGLVRTSGFGAGTRLAATGGVFSQGVGGLDAGAGPLSLQTPFIGDRALTLAAGDAAVLPSLTLSSAGAVTISNPGGATIADPDGVPGATIAISGDTVAISGTRVRATAGKLALHAVGDVTVTDGAVLETPAYVRTFGDAADPFGVSAPGGLLQLTSTGGDILLADGTRASVGGPKGAAGTFQFSAAAGQVTLDGMLDASAPDGGASFFLNTGAAFDLDAFSTGLATRFDGAIGIQSGSGDLTLSDGHSLKAGDVYLSANGGMLNVGGLIDVSGQTGGDVLLYGSDGVTLTSTGRIDAHASGYGDSRQASGGNVELGTDGTGVIAVLAGAVIDVSASHPDDRLVKLTRNGLTYYSFVPGDTGGQVTFRAPVIEGPGGDTVNVSYAGQITGADSIVLEGFKRFDLGQIAADGGYTGVSIVDGQAVLDLTATADGKLNWLGDDGPGTLVSFVQDFDVSASYGNLGGLANSDKFHARPGMELDFNGGDIVLKSNWNLGAGTVDIPAAVAAGDMKVTPASAAACALDAAACKYYVVNGKESDVFGRFTHLTYRTDVDGDGQGDVTGEPGVLTLRASGNLDIRGSITDGFFGFRDQTDPDYLNQALGGGNQVYQPYITPACVACEQIGSFQPGDLPTGYVSVSFPGGQDLSGLSLNPAPYSAAANSPAALGSLEGNTGDPIGSAELFPLITVDGAVRHVDSTGYRLVAGADLAAVDPMQIAAGAAGNVLVEGRSTYSYKGARGGTASYADTVLLGVSSGGQTGYVTADAWLQAFLTSNPNLGQDAYTYLDFSGAPLAARNQLADAATAYFADHPDQSQLITNEGGATTGVTTTLGLAGQFLADLFANPANADVVQSFIAAYTPPRATVLTNTTTASTATLVRSGTGAIRMAAAGDIDLRNGAPTYLNLVGKPTPEQSGGLQDGGAAVYTAGYRVDFTGLRTAIDPVSGQLVTIDPSAYLQGADNFDPLTTSGYQYGATPANFGLGFAGVLVANPVYAEGGGDISLDAGRDVLSRVDVYDVVRIARYEANITAGLDWLGSADQQWRVGSIGGVSNARINPQLFNEGVGALGGGDITIKAGRDVSDLSVVSDTSITTADVSSPGGGTQALLTFGGGDVAVSAGRSILGGRLDLARGQATLSAGTDVGVAGLINISSGIGYVPSQDALRIRLTDGDVTVSARGDATVGGIGGLGVHSRPLGSPDRLNALGFYMEDAGVSITADGAVDVLNTPLLARLTAANDVLTGGNLLSGLTYTAVYPGTFKAAALTGDLVVATDAAEQTAPSAVFMVPSATGELQLVAGADIAPLTIGMDDGDPGQLPGVFSAFDADASLTITGGRTFLFPGVLPDTGLVERAALHNAVPTHLGDEVPNRIYAGGDIDGMIISVPKATRIGAGQDIVNMMFFGQNISADDITRIRAERDITATTTLVQPLVSSPPNVFGPPLVAVQGNDFVLGGPGSFFLEAGRDAGPFLNSAVTNGYATPQAVGDPVRTGQLTFGGGVLSVGNEWNPWLGETGADLYVEFGVAKGANFTGGYTTADGVSHLSFRDTYLDPANLPNLDGDLFVQVEDANGNKVPDRTQPIYGPVLIKWMQAHAAKQLTAAYGTTAVDFAQAYDVFKSLPELTQRVFILDKVYFNELEQTSIPDGPSYLQYSRGYEAVNALFPAAFGYTANDLTGGGNGANTLVETGNLDLRLSTIETSRGGNIYILGPGGRVVAGSTVRTSEQAARRAYAAGALFAGNAYSQPLPAAISSIPLGYEGVLTLRGGTINSFTDGDFLLNQSRVFTETGGDVAMWSSNGDLNAGQGPKTAANFPPVVVQVSSDLVSQVDSAGAVSGAGIAAFQPSADQPAPSVFLIAPRGTVDAGDAGVRVAGNLYIAAQTVANAENFSVGGSSFGIPATASVDVAAQTSGSAAAAAAQQAAAAASQSTARPDAHTTVTATVEGYVGGDANGDTGEDECARDPRSAKCKPAK